MDTHVLIVGAGPVGLSLANELGWRRTPCLVVDAGDGSVLFPAGEFIFARTMEHLRRWGIADAVRNLGWPHPGCRSGAAFMTSVAGYELARFVSSPSSNFSEDPTYPSPEPPAIQARFTVDPYLRACADSYDCIEFRYRQRVEQLYQDESGVTVMTTDAVTGQIGRVRAAYVVGCDGAKSTVRELMGIRLEGEFAQGHNLAIYFRSRELRKLIDKAGLADICQIQTVGHPARPYITVVDGVELWRCSVYIEDTDLEPDPVEVVRAAVGTPVDIEILRAQQWTGHEVVANAYRVGRVFLAGDAAHLQWPKGGFGANTGVGDAVDLGWKLAAQYEGWGGEGLVRSYARERRPVALRNNRWSAENWIRDQKVPSGGELTERSARGEAARSRASSEIEQLRRGEYFTLGVQLGYRYEQSNVCIYDEGPIPEDRPDKYSPSSSPGARAPHVWLAPGESTLDHFGRGLTLIRLSPGLDVAAMLDAADAQKVPITVLDIDTETAAGQRVADLYEYPLVLVRPDGHVAWRAVQPPQDPTNVLHVIQGAD